MDARHPLVAVNFSKMRCSACFFQQYVKAIELHQSTFALMVERHAAGGNTPKCYRWVEAQANQTGRSHSECNAEKTRSIFTRTADFQRYAGSGANQSSSS